MLAARWHLLQITCQARAYDIVQTDGNHLTSRLQHCNQSHVQLTVQGLVFSMFLDPLRSIWLSIDLQQMPT
jgi:hypothetical protein